MKRIIIMIMVLTLSVTLFAGCSNNSASKNPNSITASGSSALQPLVADVANLYRINNPDIAITINGGGSGVGLKNVSAGAVDIGNSDVYAQEKLSASDASALIDNKVCIVGVGVIVNSEMGAYISNITKAQLKDIFSGKTTNWKDIGGPNQQIVIINRPASSGTRALFIKWGLDGQKTIDGDSSLQTDDSNALAQTVSSTKGSIGYLAFPYINNNLDKVVSLAIDNIEANYDNICKGKYNIWGYEHMYTKGQPNETVQKFLNFMKSSSVESEILNLGYGIISKLSSSVAKSR